jgi:uncharacterized protein
MSLKKAFKKKASKEYEDISNADLWAFCKEGRRLDGRDYALVFPRLQGDGVLLSCDVLAWSVVGRVNARSECELSLSGQFQATFACCTCGEPLPQALSFSRKLILKTSEAEADASEEYDLDDEVDVVACLGAVNLRDWLEDEVLLVCPMFPRHDACEKPVLIEELNDFDTQTLQDDSAEESLQEVQRPFANLADLLKIRKP